MKPPAVETRRSRRISYTGEIRVSWTDGQGDAKFAITRCLDISETGVAAALIEAIPPGSYVSIRISALRFASQAVVRHCRRHRAAFVAGFEFCCGARCMLPAPSLAIAM